jgi:23S rRNA pseudouridine1911/1915/1917 synthase
MMELLFARLLLLLLVGSISVVNGFTVLGPSTSKHPAAVAHHTLCRARPPQFNLEAIEEFEQQLNAPQTTTTTTEEEETDDLDEFQNVDNIENMLTFTIEQEYHNKRIDVAVAAADPKLSRSHSGSLVEGGHVKLVLQDGKLEVLNRKAFKVEAGMTLQIQLPTEETPTEILPQKLPLNILFEDEHMVILNKAAGMVVHPAAGNWDGTVVNALAYYLANDSPYGSGEFIGGDGSVLAEKAEGIEVDGTDGEAVSFRPGIVHRLDKGTTGCLVVAKTRASLAALSEAFKSRSVKKTYLAITVGNPGKRVAIDKPIGRHPIHRQRMRVVPDPHKKNSGGFAPKDRMVEGRSPSQAGRRALSFVDSISFDGKLSLVQVRIETGRTHQIRVHLQDRHTPVYGDPVYGLDDWNKRLSTTHKISRPLLHAYTLEIDHPITGKRLSFRAPMAEDMDRIGRAIWPEGEKTRPDLFAQK